MFYLQRIIYLLMQINRKINLDFRLVSSNNDRLVHSLFLHSVYPFLIRCFHDESWCENR